jgi:hypothetical protein
LVANWLSENQCEPVQRSSPEGAAWDLHARPYDLLITDAIWATGNALKTTGPSGNPLPRSILVGDATDRHTKALTETRYLTRPIDPVMLSCFVLMALMDHTRQVRRSPRKTVQRFEALVNDAPAGIIDVSAEGLRLEVTRVPPPFFGVRIPLVGVAFIAKRVWTKAPSKGASTLWCGGALSNNRGNAEDAWRAFVDTVPVIGSAGPQQPVMGVRTRVKPVDPLRK